MSNLILIVEDEAKLAEVVRDYLHRDGYDTHLCHRGDEVLDWLADHQPALILLDLMLPGLDGLTLCREIRKKMATPIIMTTARVEEIDRLLGLELGADDYVCKPYSPREVVARVKAVLRRTHLNNGNESDTELRLVLPEGANEARFGERKVELTALESRLLAELMRHPGRIFSRDQLMDAIYPDRRLVSDRTIDSHIKNLRRKLQLLAPEEEFVRSVYGAGYKYE
ncbi:two-component system response regulator BaeR [Saccharospirillum sp. MSK14-1]|uniref:response regulator n=1 Tax=Saccharospirillum sp. MSK14-1 TaxID=1897632 RepID=UPI000D3478F3|nr:response regulator [Saccharospirillum sp. MSK14-1]PTY37545.1 two-component system response regulator BaeR [Saccharospirillum sp. MSK14-1]